MKEKTPIGWSLGEMYLAFFPGVVTDNNKALLTCSSVFKAAKPLICQSWTVHVTPFSILVSSQLRDQTDTA